MGHQFYECRQPSGSHSPGKPTSAERGSGSCACGETREARVICPAGQNCTTAAAAAVPWQAAIVKRNKWQPYCGGSLINDRYRSQLRELS